MYVALRLQVIFTLENRTALHAALKKNLVLSFFLTLHLMKLIKNTNWFFLKMRQPYKKQKKLLVSNTNKEVTQDKE